MKGLRAFFRWFNASRAVPWLAFGVILVFAWRFLADHVFWRDEAHALLLVNCNPGFGGFLRAMAYEGTPVLWHLALWLLAKLVVLTPERLQLLHFATVAVLLVLVLWLPRTSNTVRLMMLLQVPMAEYFTYSRQYLLVILGLFVFAHVYLRNRRSPWLFVVLFLTGQVSAHGCLLSLGLLGFLVGEAWLAGERRFRIAWLLPVVGAILCQWELRVPSDMIEGNRLWRPLLSQRTVKFAGNFGRDLVLKDVMAGAFFAGFVLVALIAVWRRQVKRAALAATVIVGLAAGFFFVGATKYSCPRHHWLLSYTILVLIVILLDPKVAGRWFRWLQVLALGALFFGCCQFMKTYRFQASAISSRSRDLAGWLDRRHPGKVLLAAQEPYMEPMMVYRRAPGRVFALGRQAFIRHVIWNHPSIDFAKGDGLQMRPPLSEIVRCIREAPKDILAEGAVVVFGFDGLQKSRDESMDRIPINDQMSLRLEQVFSGAMHENYLVYVIDRRE